LLYGSSDALKLKPYNPVGQLLQEDTAILVVITQMSGKWHFFTLQEDSIRKRISFVSSMTEVTKKGNSYNFLKNAPETIRSTFNKVPSPFLLNILLVLHIYNFIYVKNLCKDKLYVKFVG
jgi:hypothetical protein